jgi:hypothetical protein
MRHYPGPPRYVCPLLLLPVALLVAVLRLQSLPLRGRRRMGEGVQVCVVAVPLWCPTLVVGQGLPRGAGSQGLSRVVWVVVVWGRPCRWRAPCCLVQGASALVAASAVW